MKISAFFLIMSTLFVISCGSSSDKDANGDSIKQPLSNNCTQAVVNDYNDVVYDCQGLGANPQTCDQAIADFKSLYPVISCEAKNQQTDAIIVINHETVETLRI